jgi:Tol biopolymer transport system component
MTSASFVLGWGGGSRRLRVVLRACADKGKGGAPGAALLLIAAALALSSPGPASAQALPPDERWRSLETEHFRVTFPEGLDSLATVAAARAEQAYATLAGSLVRAPGGRIEVVLTDHADFSNGSARVAPYNRIVVFARPPVDGFALSHFDDWLEMVLVHELVHVFHLDYGGGLSTLLRTLFGRVPSRWPFFPELASPGWIIEGLATWQESAHTESGRVRGTQHEMALRAAVLEGELEDLGQMSGDSPVWPAGSRSYIYGSLFFDYLAGRYGEAAVTRFIERVAGQWIPYRLNAAARGAFGVSFGEAWRDWEASLIEEAHTLRERLSRHAPITEPEPVTRGARQAYYAQLSPDGERLLFARSDGHSDVQFRVSAPDGSGQRQMTRTNGLSVFAWMPDGGVVYSQYHFDGPYRIRSDVHVRSADGDDRRVTDAGRVDHPSPSPDGRAAVAVQFEAGRARLVEVDLASGEIRALPGAEPAAHWAFPRVSPNGRWIAASRWLQGAFFDVVILDRSGRLVAEVTRDRALDMAPAWSADGRWLLWGSDRSGVPNVMAASVDPASGLAGEVRQVTNVLTGAAFPSADPAGRWIYMSVYHADGWDVERVPFDPARWRAPLPEDPRFRADEPFRPAPSLTPVRVGGYNPLRTLRPRYWEPDALEPRTVSGKDVVGPAFGFATDAEDAVGRHGFDLRALVATSGEVEGGFGYRWGGLGNPLLSVAAEQLWDADGPLPGERQDGVVDTLWLRERERSLSASASYRIPGFRVSTSLTLSGGVVWEHRDLLDQTLEPSTTFRLTSPNARLGDVRVSWSTSSARSFAFSTGPSEGASLLVQGRRRVHLGLADSARGGELDRGFDELVARIQAYESFPGPGFSGHTIAFRATAGAARGPAAAGSHFRVGGASGTREPVTGLALFGASSFTFPLRGYENGARRGRYAGSASLEYRFPLALVNRGFGLFPLFFDRVSGALFADAGNAWGSVTGPNPRGETLVSAGAELLTDWVTFYDIPVTLRVGVAVPLVEVDPTRPVGRDPEIYLRFGRTF